MTYSDTLQSTVSANNMTAIPANVRRELGIHSGDRLVWREVEVDGETAYVPLPPENQR